MANPIEMDGLGVILENIHVYIYNNTHKHVSGWPDLLNLDTQLQFFPMFSGKKWITGGGPSYLQLAISHCIGFILQDEQFYRTISEITN